MPRLNVRLRSMSSFASTSTESASCLNSAVATAPSHPPLARLPPSFRTSSALPSPLYLDSLVRSTLPSLSLSCQLARHPNLSLPSPVRLEAQTLLSVARPPERVEPRATLSIGSLKKVAEKHAVVADLDVRGGLGFGAGAGAGAAAAAFDPSVDHLNMNSWTDATTRRFGSFMALFAGQGAGSNEIDRRADQLERDLLDRGLDELQSIGSDTTLYTTSSLSYPGAVPYPSNSSSSNPFPSKHMAKSHSFAAPTLQHHRHYSTGPGTSAKEVGGYLNEEDEKLSKVEAAEDMDMFDLIKDKYRSPRFPLVFCHGLFGFNTIGPVSIKPLQFSYWVGVKEALEAIGVVDVLFCAVPAAASIEERAKSLCEQIEQEFAGREVNLIGHSMGGLDCRYMISSLQPHTFQIRSLTTIATPHRGSSFADFLLEDVITTKHVPALLSLMDTLGVPGGGKAFQELTTTMMAKFNDVTPDDPKVKYFSYGASFEPGWSHFYRLSHRLIFEREGPNDGLVSVDSAKWGVYKGTIENVNHLDLVGWVGKLRFGYAAFLGKPIRFKPISFYCALSESLADEGL